MTLSGGNVTRSSSLISNFSHGDGRTNFSPKYCRSEINTKIEYDEKGNYLLLEESDDSNQNQDMNESVETVIYSPGLIKEAKVFDYTNEERNEDSENEDMFSVYEEEAAVVSTDDLNPYKNAILSEISILRRTLYLFMLMVLIIQFTSVLLKVQPRDIIDQEGQDQAAPTTESIPVYNYWSVAFLTTVIFSKSIIERFCNGFDPFGE